MRAQDQAWIASYRSRCPTPVLASAPPRLETSE
jgi:hypothetical protein